LWDHSAGSEGGRVLAGSLCGIACGIACGIGGVAGFLRDRLRDRRQGSQTFDLAGNFSAKQVSQNLRFGVPAGTPRGTCRYPESEILRNLFGGEVPGQIESLRPLPPIPQAIPQEPCHPSDPASDPTSDPAKRSRKNPATLRSRRVIPQRGPAGHWILGLIIAIMN